VESVLDSIRDILLSADPELRLEIRDFGVFEVKLTKAKPMARNPRTGDRIYVPPRRKTHFKPSKLLRVFLTSPLNQYVESEQIEVLRIHHDELAPECMTKNAAST